MCSVIAPHLCMCSVTAPHLCTCIPPSRSSVRTKLSLILVDKKPKMGGVNIRVRYVLGGGERGRRRRRGRGYGDGVMWCGVMWCDVV